MTKKVAKKAAKPKAAAGNSAKDLAWLTPAKIKSIRAELVAMRDDILKTVRKQSIHEVDNGDSVDQASQSIEKELMFELSDNERTTLDMVEAAIRKIDNGTYGLCEATQKAITRARLEAIPLRALLDRLSEPARAEGDGSRRAGPGLQRHRRDRTRRRLEGLPSVGCNGCFPVESSHRLCGMGDERRGLA